MSSSALAYPHHKLGITETELMLQGYGLSLANVYFRIPDYRNVLNRFTWQFYDLYPDYPRLFEFIEFWQNEIEGPLHSVEFVHHREIDAGQYRRIVGEYHVP